MQSFGGPVGFSALSNYVIGKFGRTEVELRLLGSPRTPQDAIRGSDKTSGVVLRGKKRLAALLARLRPDQSTDRDTGARTETGPYWEGRWRWDAIDRR